MMYPNLYSQGMGACSGNYGPAATMGETASSYVFCFDVPGTCAEDIEVIVQGQYLTIRGKCLPKNDKEVEWVRSERIFGPFQRTVAIPALIDQDDIRARLEDGILEVTLQKKGEHNIPFRKIQIHKGATKAHVSSSNKNN